MTTGLNHYLNRIRAGYELVDAYFLLKMITKISRTKMIAHLVMCVLSLYD